MNGLSANISPLIEKRTIRAIGRIVRFSLYRVSRATECNTSRTVRNCPHAGRAVPSGTPSEGYYREQKLCRKFMSIGSQCKPIAVPLQAPRMRGFQRHKRCGASHAPPRARGRCPRRAVDERLHSHEIKPAQRETNDSAIGRIVRFSTSSLRGLLNAAHREQYGTALTPGGRCLRALRQTGIATNRGNNKVYVKRQLEVFPNFFFDKY